MIPALRSLTYLLAVGMASAIAGPALAQGGWTYNAGRPDLAFVRTTVRLVRDGRPVEHLERPGPVVIEAEIQNRGPGVARDVVISVTDNGEPIGRPQLPLLVTGATYRLELNWDASRGTHQLKITLDPDNKVAETDETNNVAVIDAPVPRMMWPLVVLIVLIVIAAGGLAGYAAWQLSARPRAARTPKQPEA